jgi:hypothetical protein
MTYHNYPAYVFRMTSLLEKLGIKSAIYVHQDDVEIFCTAYVSDHGLPLKSDSALTQYIASRGPRLRMIEEV